MANRERDELTVKVGGKSYCLKLSVEAMCAMEDRLSTPDREVVFGSIVDGVARGSVRSIRLFLWTALLTHHPELTLEDVSRWMDRAGGLTGLASKLADLMASTRPDPEDLEIVPTKKDGGPDRPPVADAGGTGVSSTETPVASA